VTRKVFEHWLARKEPTTQLRAPLPRAGLARRNSARQPSRDHARDLEIVLLQHNHVPVAVDAVIAEAQRSDLDPGLHQVLGGAVVVRRVIGSLGGDHDRRDIDEVRKVPRRRLLLPTEDQVRAVGLGPAPSAGKLADG
jgi:hypothetical protein